MEAVSAMRPAQDITAVQVTAFDHVLEVLREIERRVNGSSTVERLGGLKMKCTRFIADWSQFH
jgi:hypothetical protein